jgi:methylphosphotriester-DNA--protein-cysteine methyltransferase
MVSRVILYMHDHMTESISVQQLADMVYVSKSFLSRAFKQRTGLSLMEYLTPCGWRRQRRCSRSAISTPRRSLTKRAITPPNSSIGVSRLYGDVYTGVPEKEIENKAPVHDSTRFRLAKRF